MTSPGTAPEDTTPTTCYRHAKVEAGVSCQRCDRKICVDCQTQASVGFHCPECLSKGGQKVYTRSNLPGLKGIVTNALIALNMAAFAYQVIEHGATVSDDGTTAAELALNGFFIDQLGEWWRIVTSGFVHVGLLHLGVNMYSLYRIGPMLERQLGSPTYALAYAASLLGGSFGALLLEPRAFTLGASGAIFGLLGLLVMLFRSRGIGLAQSGLLNVLILNGLISLSGFVSLGGHAGGFVVGLLLGVLYWGVNPGDQPIFGSDKVRPMIMTVALGAAAFAGSLWAAGRWDEVAAALGF